MDISEVAESTALDFFYPIKEKGEGVDFDRLRC
jgi:hypothetical protein